MGNRPWRTALALALLMMSAEAFAQARGWTIAPSVGLRGTYTDNVSLAAAPQRGEFVTAISPAISINGRGNRVSGSLAYTANALFYARNSDENRLANQLRAFGNLEAIENFFFVDAQGDVSQNYISPFGAQPFDIISTTENRTETRTFSLSPYVRGQFAGGYSYELRNRNTWTSADTSQLANVHTRQWTANLASPIRLFGWGLDAADNRVSYEGDFRPEQDNRLVRAHLFFQPDPTLRLSVSAGRERNNYTLQQERANDIYGYGVLWRPTARTTAELNWEHRYFGSSRLVSLSHRTRLTAWSATYSRSASTFQQELLRLPPGNTAALLDAIFMARITDPAQRRSVVEEFLRTSGMPAFLTNSLAFYTQQVFLQENLQGSMAILGVRNAVTFTAFRSRRTSLTDTLTALPAEVFLAAGQDVRQHGFGINASHRLTPFTSLGVSGNRTFAEADEPSTIKSRNDFLSLNLNHTLSPKTSTVAGVSYSRFQSSGAPTSHARSVFAGLDHRF